MAKVGVITFHRTINAGALLQTYALQTVISGIGHKCEIVDYQNRYINRNYLGRVVILGKSVRENIKTLLLIWDRFICSIKYKNFEKKYLLVSQKKYSGENIQECNREYDVMVVGSDQVWNMKLNGEDSTFMLDFFQNRKVSYAASFGYSMIPREYLNITRNGLMHLDSISVRENEGVALVSELTGRSAVVCLDPTLLLSRESWDTLVNKPLISRKFILVYAVAATTKLIQFARDLSSKTGIKVIYLNYSYYRPYGFKSDKSFSPIDFVNYVRSAEYVVTSSYHGVCFSCIYGKKFFYELESTKSNNNSRLITLSRSLGFEDREINDLHYSQLLQNESKYDKNFDDLRGRSIEFLKMKLKVSSND